jgi:hypothetical protein
MVLERWNLSICHVTKVCQKLSGHLQQLNEDKTTAIISKLPFFVFKGQPGKKSRSQYFRKKLKDAANQMLGSMNPSTEVDQHYPGTTICQVNDDAFLLVDHYKVHMMKLFVTACNNIGVDIDYILVGYTSVLDVGFNARYKRLIRDCHHM